MFTGLVRSLGTAQLINSSQLRVTCPRLQPQLAYGDSVAVDGLCLTVVEILPDGFLADVSPETLRRSTWGQGSLGPRTVNLEPALRVGDKLGGILSAAISMGWGNCGIKPPLATPGS